MQHVTVEQRLHLTPGAARDRYLAPDATSPGWELVVAATV
jgi:hypothetical protein